MPAHVEKMSIALPPEMAALVRSAVSAGEYASASEVVRDALREWNRKRRLHGVNELRALWREALSDGNVTVDADEVLDRLERKDLAAASTRTAPE